MCIKKRTKYPSRWCILASCLMMYCLAGTEHAFGLISDCIKDSYGLSQQQIDTIALFGNIGAYTAIIPGIFNNRFGPSISIWIGIVITSVGIALLTLITNKMLIYIFPASSEIYIYFAMLSNFIFNHGLAWLGLISVTTIVQNFPKVDHSKILGIAKGYIGIGSAFISIFNIYIANGNVNIFMMSILLFTPFSSIICAYFVTILPNKNIILNYQSVTEMGYDIKNNKNIDIHKDSANFTFWYMTLVTFAIYLVVMSLLQNVYNFTLYARLIIFSIALILYAFPWIFAIFCHGSTTLQTEDMHNIDFKISKHSQNINIQHESHDNQQSKSIDENEIGMPGIFKHAEFWLLYLTHAIISGVSLTLTNNVSQIVESASSKSPNDEHENKSLVTSFVAIISFGSFVGRISGGLIAGTINKFHCTFWLIMSPLLMSISQLFLTFIAQTNLMLLFIGGAMVGLSHGWMSVLTMIAVIDIWGTKYLSGNQSLFDTTSIFGGFIFATEMFGRIYDKYAIDNKCYGDKCYKYSFLICSIVSLIALFFSIIVWKITVKKCKQKLLIHPLLS